MTKKWSSTASMDGQTKRQASKSARREAKQELRLWLDLEHQAMFKRMSLKDQREYLCDLGMYGKAYMKEHDGVVRYIPLTEIEHDSCSSRIRSD